MAEHSFESNLTTQLVEEYSNFWPGKVQAKCDDFKKRFAAQMYENMKSFKKEMYSILEAVDHACKCESERQAIHRVVQPMMVKTYNDFYASAAISLQFPASGAEHLEFDDGEDALVGASTNITPVNGPGETDPESSSIHVRLSPPITRAGPQQTTASCPESLRKSPRVQSQVRGSCPVPIRSYEVRRTLERSEVEKRAWIFSFRRLGDGYFVLRCGTAENPTFFDRDPWSYNRLKKHFSAIRRCHDVEKTRNMSADDIMCNFGYRVQGIDGDFVDENNRQLLQTGGRKRKEPPALVSAHRQNCSPKRPRAAHEI